MINPAIIELLQRNSTSHAKATSATEPRIRVMSFGKPTLLLPQGYAGSIGLIPSTQALNSREAGFLSKINALFQGSFSAYDPLELLKSCYSQPIDIEIIDADPEENASLCWDLNHPIPYSWHDRYDLVIDSGTHEHVFNIGTSLLSAAQLPNSGGLLIGALPFYSSNHGFYNINANCLAELFCPTNGYQLLALEIHGYSSAWHSLRGEASVQIDLAQHLKNALSYDQFLQRVQASQIPANRLNNFNTIYYAALRHTLLPITPPQQRKYKG